MSVSATPASGATWICERCWRELAVAKVTLAYMGSEFPVELPRCPQCGLVLIDEALALGKMAEVERILEDK